MTRVAINQFQNLPKTTFVGMRKGMKGIQMFGGSSVVQTEEIRSDVSARQNRAKRVTESTLPLPEENFLTNGIYPNSLLITQHTAYRSNVMRLRRGMAAPWRLYPPRTDARASAVARAPGVSSASFQCQLKFLAQTNGKVNRKSRAFSPRTNGKHSRQF